MQSILALIGTGSEEAVWSRGPEQTALNPDGTHGFPMGRGRHLAEAHRHARRNQVGRAAGLDLLAVLQRQASSTPPGSPMRAISAGAFDDAAGHVKSEAAGLYMLKHALLFLPRQMSAVHARCFAVSPSVAQIAAAELRTLDARGAQLSVGYIERIMRRCRRLRTLNLYGCRIGARGVARLAATLPSCRIQQLGLCGNGIGSAGLEHLAGVLPHCADLRMLDLRWNEIGDDGARALAAALPLVKRAVKLHVQFNSLSERAEGILLRTSKA